MEITRKEIIAHITFLKEQEINRLKEARDIYASSADLDEESTLTVDDFSQQAQSTDSVLNLDYRIEDEQNKLNAFIRLQPLATVGITEGNVVFTDKINMVIGLTIKNFSYQDKPFIGISIDAPVYKNLIGKEEEDEILFNNEKCRILRIL